MRILALALCLVVGASSCSGAGSSAGETTAADAPSAAWGEGIAASDFAPDVAVAADALVGAHGDDALLALFYALERGYSAAQVIRGASAGSVKSDGSFTDGTTPDASSAAVISLPEGDDSEGAKGLRVEGSALVLQPAVARAQTIRDGALVVDVLRQKYGEIGRGDADTVLVIIIIGLAKNGYSLEQITDSIVLGTGFPALVNINPETPQVCLFDLDGVRIKPVVPLTLAFEDNDDLCHDRTIGNSEPTATETPAVTRAEEEREPTEGLDLDGTFRGPIDLTGFYELADPEEGARHITMANSELIAVFDAGQLVSVSGSVGTSNPEIDGADGTLCGTDLTWTFDSAAAASTSTAGGFQIPVQLTVSGTTFCEGETEPLEDRIELTAFGSADIETGTVRFLFEVDGDSSGITATLDAG